MSPIRLPASLSRTPSIESIAAGNTPAARPAPGPESTGGPGSTRRSAGPTAGRVSLGSLVGAGAAFASPAGQGAELLRALNGGGRQVLEQAAAAEAADGPSGAGLATRSLQALGLRPAAPAAPRLGQAQLQELGRENAALAADLLRKPPADISRTDIDRLVANGDRIGNTVRQMPVAELNANRGAMHALLDGQAQAAADVMKHVKDLPVDNPVHQAASKAQLETHALAGQTRVRWAASNVGNGMLKLVGAPFVAVARQLNLLPDEESSRR